MTPRMRRLAFFLLAISCKTAPQPYGEALVVVDTDLPGDALSARLRVDTYAADGTWIDSRDISRRTRDAWPTSFSVYETDETKSRPIRVRLRLYPEGLVRDYRGEVFVDRPQTGAPGDAVPFPAGDGNPRLVSNGVDVTPSTEPRPEITVDRLLVLELVPGHRVSVTAKLAGSCVGTMADMAHATTCIDTPNARVDAAVRDASDSLETPQATAFATYGLEPPCDVAPRGDEEVCVRGGPFVLGDEQSFGSGDEYGSLRGFPERFGVVRTMLFDKYEVTVGRWRAAVAKGFAPPFPVGTTNAPLPKSPQQAEQGNFCTYSDAPAPGGEDREQFPMNCVRWDSARAFCRFIGSDLPTEAEWEHAAAAGGRANKTLFPWGDDFPTCDGVVFARDGETGSSGFCVKNGYGPAKVDVTPTRDVTPDGVFGFAGSMIEHVLDSAAPFESVCWARADPRDLRCVIDGSDTHVIRGGSWQTLPSAMTVRFPQPLSAGNVFDLGFRCARPGVNP
jgi:formylglycine-generating enzyme required for sulfatase activity